MRIAFLSNEYPPLPAGGIGTNLRNLARTLVRQGHHVWVVGWGPETRFDDQGVRVRFVGHTRVPKLGWLLNRRRAFRVLAGLVAGDGVEIVEAPDWCGPSAGLRLACPVVVRCNGSAVYFADLVGDAVRPSVRLAERLAVRGADSVAAASRFTAARSRALFGLDAEVAVVPNGIDVEPFAAAGPAEVEAGSVLYFGTIVRKKGVLDLPAMMARLLERQPHARLRLLGRDSADRTTGATSTWQLVEAGLGAGARSRTAYLGGVPSTEVAAHVRRAAVCVFPSYGEALPMAWMEAMAAAKCVVAYDIGWAREVIRPQDTGLLVPAGDTAALADAVAGLLDDPGAAAAMGARACADVCARFSAEAAAEASLAWYRRVIREAAP